MFLSLFLPFSLWTKLLKLVFFFIFFPQKKVSLSECFKWGNNKASGLTAMLENFHTQTSVVKLFSLVYNRLVCLFVNVLLLQPSLAFVGLASGAYSWGFPQVGSDFAHK